MFLVEAWATDFLNELYYFTPPPPLKSPINLQELVWWYLNIGVRSIFFQTCILGIVFWTYCLFHLEQLRGPREFSYCSWSDIFAHRKPCFLLYSCIFYKFICLICLQLLIIDQPWLQNKWRKIVAVEAGVITVLFCCISIVNCNCVCLTSWFADGIEFRSEQEHDKQDEHPSQNNNKEADVNGLLQISNSTRTRDTANRCSDGLVYPLSRDVLEAAIRVPPTKKRRGKWQAWCDYASNVINKKILVWLEGKNIYIFFFVAGNKSSHPSELIKREFGKILYYSNQLYNRLFLLWSIRFRWCYFIC